MTCKDCVYARKFRGEFIMKCRNHGDFCTLDAVICNEFKLAVNDRNNSELKVKD